MKTSLFLFLLLIVISPFAKSNDLPYEGYPYLGIGAAHSELKEGDLEDFFDSDVGFSLVWGSRYSKHWGFEISYNDFGDLEGVASVLITNLDSSVILVPADDLIVSTTSIGAGANFILPVRNKVDLFLSFGWHSWEYELTSASPLVSSGQAFSGNDFYYGLGATFHVNKRISLSARYNRYNLNKVDQPNDLTIASLNIHF